jgi:hypothetical protein
MVKHYPATPSKGIGQGVPVETRSGVDSSLPVSIKNVSSGATQFLTESWFLLKEDGYRFLLEDGSGFIQLEH